MKCTMTVSGMKVGYARVSPSEQDLTVQRKHMLSLYNAGEHTRAELAELFSVSRTTVYRECTGRSSAAARRRSQLTGPEAGQATDFWRKTHDGFVRDSGHLYWREWTGDFVAEVRVTGQYRDLYDQAGLMVRADETTWLKCGIELVAGVQRASAVVTRDSSDWSVVLLPTNPPTTWLRVTRRGADVEIRYSLDGRRHELLRVARLSPTPTVRVGPMCASPEGAGFTVTFEDFAIRPPDDE